jgi:phosphoglycerate kinase
MKKLSIRDLQLEGKRVLVRVDFNVPLDARGRVSDDTRIVEALPTIRYILERGGKVILMSHLGRPKGKPKPEFSLSPVAVRLSELLSQPVPLAPDCVGPEVERMIDNLKNGDCLLLENLRFHPEEEANDPVFAAKLGEMVDVFVNDAFGTAHRAHASTVGITRHVELSAAGLLMEKELEYLTRAVEHPARPYKAILGGAKISGKIDVIQNLLSKVDGMMIGGGMMFTFFKAQGYEVGDSLVEEEKIPLAKQILDEVSLNNKRLLLPVDTVIADRFANDASTRVVKIDSIPAGWRGLDIGPETVSLFKEELMSARTIVWNGPMGVFEMERFAAGTVEIAKALAEATNRGAVTIVGGGDSAAAVALAGLQKQISHVSTGGGASLEFLEGKILPGVAALTDKE